MTDETSATGAAPGSPHDAAGVPPSDSRMAGAPPELDAAVPPPPQMPPPEIPVKPREPFPFGHLLMAILYVFIAGFVFWIVIFLAFLQYVTIAIAGEKNDELQHFSRMTARYMQEMFDYITLSRAARPFPLGPFPKE
jgi:hypothetical protein